MYSGIYISLNLQFVLSTRKEAQISITQLKERNTVGKNLWRGGTYVTQISISQSILLINSSAPEGGIDELWEICYIPVDLFGYWFRSVKQKVESEMSDEKKAWKGYALGLDSHISVNPCDKFFESASRKWKKRCIGSEPQRGGVCPQIYISFNCCD